MVKKSPSLFEIGYCAGLFEGEGYVATSHRNGGWELKITMTDKEPLEIILSVLGGTLTGPHSRNKKVKNSYKDFWTWRISGYNNVLRFYTLSEQALSPRRKTQIKKVLENKPKIREISNPCGRNNYAGFRAHKNKGEAPCLQCRIAATKYQWERNHKDIPWPGISPRFRDRYYDYLLIPHG